MLPAERLTGVAVGMSDFEPRDQQKMTPAELNARTCGQVTTEVGAAETVTLTCPTGVIGQYLIVQTLGRHDYLILCEVEAGREIPVFTIFLWFRLSCCN